MNGDMAIHSIRELTIKKRAYVKRVMMAEGIVPSIELQKVKQVIALQIDVIAPVLTKGKEIRAPIV